MEKVVILIRHGLPVNGHLGPEGVQQIEALIPMLIGYKATNIILKSSIFDRAKESAEIIANALGIKMIVQDKLLGATFEKDFRVLIGNLRDDLQNFDTVICVTHLEATIYIPRILNLKDDSWDGVSKGEGIILENNLSQMKIIE